MCAMRGMDQLVTLPDVTIRPEFLEKFRIASNGAEFRVQRLRRIWLLGPTWCTVHSAGSYSPPTDHPSEAAARATLRLYAWRCQCEHDTAQHGWQQV